MRKKLKSTSPSYVMEQSSDQIMELTGDKLRELTNAIEDEEDDDDVCFFSLNL